MVVIVYETQGGTSRRYAEWLSERIGAECISAKDVGDEIDTGIIYVGWRSGPMIVGLKDFPLMKNVTAVVCVALERYDEKAIDVLRRKNGIDNIFYVRGGMDRSKLSFGQKLLLGAVSIKMLFFNRSPEDREVRRVMDHGGDLSSPDQLDGIAEWYVKS